MRLGADRRHPDDEGMDACRQAGPVRLWKVVEYLDADARLVWVIDPAGKRATVYRSRSDIRILGLNDQLEGYDVLPGFLLPMSKLFAF
jgi:Uma2 family endonuclease